MSCRTYLHQILVAGVVLGQQDEVVIASVIRVLEGVVIVPCHIHLAAYDRLHLRELFSHLQELLHTIHVSVVSDG